MRARALRNASAFAALVALTGCRKEGGEREAYLRYVTEAEAPLEAGCREFDAATARRDLADARRAAERTAAAASSARERIGLLAVPPSLETARREELVFLSHLTLGFRRFAADGNLAELQSVLRRGRAHQARGREAARYSEGGAAAGESSPTSPRSRRSGPTSGSRPRKAR